MVFKPEVYDVSVSARAQIVLWHDEGYRKVDISGVIFHFTPTSASWTNQIEIWNGILTRKVIRGGTFASVKALNKAIESFIEHWNNDCQPIQWTATAEEILDKVRTITSHMEVLLHATEIDDVTRQAA